MKRISVIMPAFNESDGIYENIATTAAILKEAGLDAEIVAVDDGSTDGTYSEIVRAAAECPAVVPAQNPYNMGKGMALRTGFDHATGDIVVFLDADLDLHPSQIGDLIDVLDDGPYDVVITSKHHPKSRLHYPVQRKVVSWGYYRIIKTLFGLPVRDTQTGLKIFRREVLDEAFHRLLVKRYAYDVELLAVAVRLGFTIYEVPVVLDFKRQQTWGRIRFSDVMNIFMDTLAIFYRLRLLKYYDNARPPWPRGNVPVLIVLNGTPPSEQIIRRITVDTDAVVSCVADGEMSGAPGVDCCFRGMDDLRRWIADSGEAVEVVGFLGRDCVPMGSWVKNAVRNFDDPSVDAVCGPVVAESGGGLLSRVAGMLDGSTLVAGPETFLRSIRRVSSSEHGLQDNIFFRAEAFDALDTGGGFRRMGRYIAAPEGGETLMKYDPDVAVSVAAPSLPAPFFTRAWRDALESGRLFAAKRLLRLTSWPLASIAFVLFLGAGWFLLPLQTYAVTLGILMMFGLAAVLMYFDPAAVVPFMIALPLVHLIRAVGFLAGTVSGRRRAKDGG